MKLLTQEIARSIPALYATENEPPETKRCVVKFFNPSGAGTWYAFEANARLPDGSEIPLREATEKRIEYEDVIFYGFAHITEGEWGNFSLRELESVRGVFGLKIERDMYYQGETAAEIEARGH